MEATSRIAEVDHNYVKSGHWKEWSPSLMIGKDIFGATIGI
ncbi:hypothetical protein [Siminovitchia fordii]|nr:hypothetical protein [Siminovitchia fordii]